MLTKVWKVKEINKSLEISWGQEQLGNVHMPRTGLWDEGQGVENGVDLGGIGGRGAGRRIWKVVLNAFQRSTNVLGSALSDLAD